MFINEMNCSNDQSSPDTMTGTHTGLYAVPVPEFDMKPPQSTSSSKLTIILQEQRILWLDDLFHGFQYPRDHRLARDISDPVLLGRGEDGLFVVVRQRSGLLLRPGPIISISINRSNEGPTICCSVTLARKAAL